MNLTLPGKTIQKGKTKIVKKHGRCFMQSTDTPIVLWPLAYTFSGDIQSRIASNKSGMQERTPFGNTYGYTSFSWYQWIWFWEHAKT